MFAGIVECACPVQAVEPGQGSIRLAVDLAPLRVAPGSRLPDAPAPPTAPTGGPAARQPLVRLGASVALNGCCLTVAECRGDVALFDVVAESLARTNLGSLLPGDHANVERSLRYGEPVDGHFVAGHVETTGEVLALDEHAGDVRLGVRCGPACASLLLPKGSIAIDGVSLTIATLERDRFTVALVPHTLRRTTLGARRAGDRVNLEPDLIGRWILAAVERQRG